MLNDSGAVVTSNYRITTVVGELKVEKRPVHITPAAAEKIYDGSPLEQKTYTLSSDTPLVKGHSLELVSSSVLSDAGSCKNIMTFKVISDDGDVTDNYSVILIGENELTVKKRGVTVTTESNEWVYDGNAHTDERFDIDKFDKESGTGMLDAHTATVSRPTLLTDVGEAPNKPEIKIAENGADKTGNYEIKYVSGTLRVTERPITVTAADGEWTYDGKAHFEHGRTLSCDLGPALADGHFTEVVTDTKITDVIYDGADNVSTKANDLTVRIKDAAGDDKTANYKIGYVSGTLKINPREVKVTAADTSFVYDGDAHTSNKHTAVGLADGHTTIPDAEGTGFVTEVGDGEVVNYVTVKITDKSGDDKTANYTISYAPGKIKIIRRSITVVTGSAEKIYDGDPLSCDTVSVGGGLGLVGKHRVVVKELKYVTDAGKYDNKLGIEIVDGTTDKTENYAVKLSCGKLNIKRRPVTVTTSGNKWIYDGDAHTDDGFVCAEFDAASHTGKLDGHSVSVYGALTSVTEVSEGKVDNKFAVVFEENGVDKTGNYDIKYVYGKLEIERRKVYVTTKDKTWVYDGDPHTFTEYTVRAADENTGVVDGQTDSADGTKSIASVTDVADGEKENKFSVAVALGNTDKSGNYEIIYDYGKIKIDKRPITVSLDDKSVIYDGAAHKCDSVSVTVGSLVSGHSLSFTVVSDDLHDRHIDAGTHYDKIASVGVVASGKGGTTDKSQNYEITGSDFGGTLTIKQRPITITSKSREWIYDGEVHGLNEFDITSELSPALVSGHKIGGLNTTVKFTDVDLLPNVYEGELTVTAADGTNVKDNYDVTLKNGILEIKQRPITITSKSGEWIYDGKPHGIDAFDVTSDLTPALVKDHKIGGLTAIGVIIDAGSTDNVYDETTLTVTSGDGKNVKDNYAVTFGVGTLTVKQRDVTVTAGSDRKEYDGTPLTCNDFDAENLADGHIVSVSDILLNGSQLDVGTSPSTVEKESVKIVDRDGDDKTKNYNIITADGTLEVYSSSITVRAKDTVREYDGQHQRCDVEITHGRVVDGYTVTASESMPSGVCSDEIGHMDVGVHTDVITKVMVFDAYGNDVTRNYVVSVLSTSATLTITKRELTLRAGTTYAAYDGTPQYAQSTEIVSGSKIDGHNYVGTFVSADGHSDDGHIEYGDHAVVLTDVKVYDYADNDVTDNYDLTVLSDIGNLHIEKRHIIVVAGSAEKVYDGEPLTCDDVLLDYNSPYELADGHKLVGKGNGRIVEIGYTYNSLVPGSVRVIDVNNANADVSELYYIEYSDNYGVLIVTNGSSGGDGQGWGNLDLSGGISTKPSGDLPDGEPTVVFTVRSDNDGYEYFRIKSFGDYLGGSWSEAAAYPLTAYNAWFLSAYALEAAGAEKHHMTITAKQQNVDYMQPYYSYLTDPSSKNDTIIVRPPWKNYDVDYISYEYSPKDKFSLAGTAYGSYERAYSEYVKSNYLQLPDGVRSELLRIASANGLVAGEKNIIIDVAEFVSGKVRYSLNFQPYVGDIALFFFEQAETGICQHYATAATAMYRALGIPARYVVGFASATRAGKETDVTAMQAHAWVEVYIDGMGWVRMEVTGSGNGSGGSGGGIGDGSGGGSGGSGDGKASLTVKPVDVDKVYDGTALVAKSELEGDNVWRMLMDGGYSYKAKVSGSRIRVGKSESTITELTLFDRMGADVTDNFVIDFEPGVVLVTPPQIVVTVYSLQKQYDGKPLSYGAADYYVSSMPVGYSIEFELVGSLTEPGKLSFADVKAASRYRVYYNNIDVTDREGYAEDSEFYIKLDGEELTVEARTIEITSGSAIKPYDGTPLKSDDFRISGGGLVGGHSASVKTSGSITDVGSVENAVEEIVIVDADGNNVTHCYKITVRYGRLTVTD